MHPKGKATSSFPRGGSKMNALQLLHLPNELRECLETRRLWPPDTTMELDTQVTPDRTSPAAREEEAGGRGRSMSRPSKNDRPKCVQSRPMKYKDFVTY